MKNRKHGNWKKFGIEYFWSCHEIRQKKFLKTPFESNKIKSS
jgi:hypothetical protein